METNGGGFGGEKEKVRGDGSRNGGDLNERDGHQKLARRDSYGPTFYNGGNVYYDGSRSTVAAAGAGAAAKTGQLFPTTFKSPGMASLRCPFTSAQWQELEQQALIYKYMMAAMPVPLDLIIPIRKSLASAALTTTTTTTTASPHLNLGWGSFNLRFSGNLDPEPGRCRRTDGKKWRCSRDVAPGQKYCERHMHRGRPRSRKPVEENIQNKISASNSSSSSSSSSTSTMSGLPSHLVTKPYTGFFTKLSNTTDFKLPLQTLVPSEKGSSRYLNWVKGSISDPMGDNQQLQVLHSKLGGNQQVSRSNTNVDTSILNYQDYMKLLSEPGDLQDNTRQNDHQDYLFLNTDLGSLEPDTTSRQQQESPRGFIDAWSQMSCSNNNKSSENNKLPLSSLTLSMSHGEDMDAIHMGLGVVNDSERDSSDGVKSNQPLNWMIPVSWHSPTLGGPLAEALQSGTSAGTKSSSSLKGYSDKSWCGGLNLMRDGWGEVSPRESLRLVSSPTGVLQKTLATLSDSSSGSSPTVAAKSEIALQWLNQQNN